MKTMSLSDYSFIYIVNKFGGDRKNIETLFFYDLGMKGQTSVTTSMTSMAIASCDLDLSQRGSAVVA